jgi:hypothetical protein
MRPCNRSPRRPALLLVLAAAILCALVVPATSTAAIRVLERLNFESGNLRQWDDIQALPGRVGVVTWPRKQGRYAARFVVRPGDDPINASGNRAEAFELTGERQGVASWWRWSTRFPRRFRPIMGDWNIFTQWHHSGPTCQPNVTFHVERTSRRAYLGVNVRGGWLNVGNCTTGSFRRWRLAPLRRARWHTFVFHVKWSSDPNVGFVEVWLNGRKRIRRTHLATLYAGQFVYVKQGYARNYSSRTHVVFHDGLIRFRR